MKISYLDSNEWSDISREERLFCAELYYAMRNDLKPFLRLVRLDDAGTYDIGYEVCFYRDVMKAHGKSARAHTLPAKRTFDLAVMNDELLLIVEAKANEAFGETQLETFQRDRRHLQKLFSLLGYTPPKIHFCGIHSDLYRPSSRTRRVFDSLLTWKQIAQAYPSSVELFRRATEIYEGRRRKE